jgi:hypothetical protein
MKNILVMFLAILLAVTFSAALFAPAEAQSAPPINPDAAWQPPEEGGEAVAPSVGVETYLQTYPNLQIMTPPVVPSGLPGSIVNAYIVNSHGQVLSTLRGNEVCYLIVSLNGPGYFYLWEYYPAGSTPYGHWLAYRWYRPSAGVWRIGPFQAGAWDANGRYVWKIWYQSGSYFSTRSLSFNYNRGYYLPGIPNPTPQSIYPPTISSFTASLSTIELGQTTTLTWTSSNATGASISPEVGTIATSGSTTVTPLTTTTYTLTANGNYGSPSSSQVTVVVKPRVAPSFTVSESTIQAGKSATLSWTAPSATRVYISGVGNVNTSGVTQVSPENPTTYTMTATYVDGSTQTAYASVNVEQPPYVLYGLIVLLAIAAILITVLLIRRPRTDGAVQATGTRSSTMAAPATVAGTESPSTRPVDVPPAKLLLPDGTEMLLAGNNRSMGRQDFDKFLPSDKRSFISRQHINVWYENNRYYIEDRSSTNGTRINGAEIKGNGRHELNDGDVIELAGKLSITFRT